MSFEYTEITDPLFVENKRANDEENFIMVRAKDYSEVPIALPDWQPEAHCFTTEFRKYEQDLTDFEVRPDDVWVASYPKSGTTWCQEMVWLICNELNFEAARAETLRTRFPFLDVSLIHDINSNSFAKVREMERRPRFIKTHLPVSMLPKSYWKAKPKTVYIKRNPKAVGVSYYHHSRRIFYRGTMENFIQSFIQEHHFYSPIHAHVIEYHELRDCDNVLLISYEEMKHDLASVVERVCQFFGKSYSESQLSNLYEHLSFDSMLNNKACNYESHTATVDNSDLRFLRKGKTDSWKEELSPELIDALDRWTLEKVPNEQHRKLNMAAENHEGDMSEISSLTDSSDEGKKVVEEVVEAVEEIDKPAYSEEDLETLVGFIRGMIILFDYEDEDFNDEVAETIKLWLTDANNPLLFIFYDGNRLSASLAFPLCPINDLMYFMREQDQLFNVLEQFHDDILFGTLHGDIEGSLLVLLEQVYGPMILSNVDWSESVKANVINGFNAFMTYLSELHYKLSGFTLLYVPREGSDMEVQEVVLNRSMIKRLEAVVIDWTAQIRATLSDTQHFVPDDLVCPSDEYSFWLYRHEVLSAIRLQYNGPNVQHIVRILELAQSLYIKHLRDVLRDLDKEIEIAESNIPFLKLLVDPCFAIGTLETADDFCSQLIYVMHIIRFIGQDSSYLNKDESMTKLFLYLSNEIVACCMRGIDVDRILAGAPRYGIEICKMKINCCESYKIIYEEMLEHFKSEFTWNLDYAAIFNRINAFLQRLHDILEVCDAMLIFGKYAEGTTYTSYRFFCNNAAEYERRCDQVEKIFHSALATIESVGGTILDINNKHWYRYIGEFRDTLKSLDDIIENLLSNVFLMSENLEEKLNVLVTLLNFYQRESVRESFMRKIGEVWSIFNNEIIQLSKDISAGITVYPALLPSHAGRYAVLKMRFDHLTHLRTLIVNCRFFPEYPKQEEVLALYEACEKQVKFALKGFNESWSKSIPSDMASWYQRNLICRSNVRPGLFEVNIERRLLLLFDEAHYFKILGAPVPMGLDLEKHENTLLTFDNVLRLVLYFNGVISSISDKERLFFKPMIQQTERKLEPLRSKLTWEEDLSEFIDSYVVNVRELLELIELYKRENQKIVDLVERIYGMVFVRLDLGQHPVSMAQLIDGMTEQKQTVLTELVQVMHEISTKIFTVRDSIGSNLRKMSSSWEHYVRKIDKLLTAAIFTCTFNTLRGVHSALENANSNPILLIEILLKQEGTVYEPPVEAVEQTLRRLTDEVCMTIKPVNSMAKYNELDDGERSFYVQLLEHPEYRQISGMINETIDETVQLLRTYQAKWNVFRPFWCVDKVAFIERFKLSAMTSEAFQTNIEKFEELQNQLSTQGELIVCKCVEIDALKLKYALTSHIAEWQTKYIDYLKCIAYGKIIDFNNVLKSNVEELRHEPKEVYELKRLEERYQACYEELPTKELEIDIILKYFVVLEKYIADLLPEAYELRHNIDSIWAQYRADLREIREQIDNYQDQFKLSMTGAADALKVDALEMLKMLRDEMPTTEESPEDSEELSSGCSLRMLSDLQVYCFEEELKILCNAARKEHELELEIERVSLLVCPLAIEIRKTSVLGADFVELTNHSHLFLVLNDNIAIIDRLRRSPHRYPFQARIDYWEQTLGLLEQILELLVELQADCRTLFEFQRLNDLSASCSELDRFDGDFNACFAIWCEQMRYISTARLVEDVCPAGREFLEELEVIRRSINQQMEQLKTFLAVRRDQFPRFYLLSDWQLVSFLAQPFDRQRLQRTLAIIYENVAGISVGSGSLESMKSAGIASVCTRDGECIPFAVPLKAHEEASTPYDTVGMMIQLDRSIRDALQDLLPKCHSALRAGYFKRVESGWLRSWPLQLCLKSAELKTTQHTKNALAQCSLLGRKKPLKMLRCLHTKMLEQLTACARRVDNVGEGADERWQRKKLNDLLIVELNARDLIERLYLKSELHGVQSIEWISQLHSYLDQTTSKCFVQLLETHLSYGYECKRSTEPALLTPTSEKARIATLCAMKSKQIPLLIGKSEATDGRHTFLDSLAHSFGVFFRKVSCDPQDQAEDVTRVINGMRKLGGWLAFFDFERISSSIVVRQIGDCVRKKTGTHRKMFSTNDDAQPRYNANKFQIVTVASMLPLESGNEILGQIDRTLYRPVHFFPADSWKVLESWLWLAGFEHCTRLTNLIKLFITNLAQEMAHSLGYELSAGMINKVLCVHRSLLSNRPLIVCGGPGTGKSVAIHVALKMLEPSCETHRLVPSVLRKLTDPKSFDRTQFDGIVSEALRKGLDSVSTSVRKCLILDSVPSAEWIMGAVQLARHAQYVCRDFTQLDVANGGGGQETASPTQNGIHVKVIVECCSPLDTMTPSAVSHFALVHIGPGDLRWRELIEVWLKSMQHNAFAREWIGELTEKHFDQLLAFHQRECPTVATVSDVALARTFIQLFNSLLSSFDSSKMERHLKEEILRKLFFFCCVWSIGGSLEEEDSRGKYDFHVRERHPEAAYPLKGTVFQYHVDLCAGVWRSWETLLTPSASHRRLFVQTPQTVANEFITRHLMKDGAPVLLGSESVAGKTALIEHILYTHDHSVWSSQRIVLTKGTTVDQIRGRLQCQTLRIMKHRLYPKDRKRMVCFFDDLHTATSNPYAVQEFVRNFCETSGWYEGTASVSLQQCQMVAAMRLQRCEGPVRSVMQSLLNKCHVLMLTAPTDDELGQIFSTSIVFALESTANDCLPKASPVFQLLAVATVDFIARLTRWLPPTPTRPRYQFSLHTIASIVRSVCSVLTDDTEGTYRTDKPTILRLWIHECFRETWDRLERADYKRFNVRFNETISEYFEVTLHGLCPNLCPLYGDLLPSTDGIEATNSKNPYVDIRDTDKLIDLAEGKIMNPSASTPSAFIIHREAVEQATKLLRCIRLKRVGTMLVGRPGGGRSVVCELAARLSPSPATFHRINTSDLDEPGQMQQQFLTLFRKCLNHRTLGMINLDSLVDGGQPNERLMELLNRIVLQEDLSVLFCDNLAPLSKQSTEGWRASSPPIDWVKVQANLHIILCVPSDDATYRMFSQRYPSLLVALTVNCVHDWTLATLQEISKKYLLKNVPLNVPIRLDAVAADGAPTLATESSKQKTRTRESLVQSTEERLQIATHDLLFRIHYAAQTEVTFLIAGKRNIIAPCSWYFELLHTFKRSVGMGYATLRGAAGMDDKFEFQF
uniref:AAA+ ATPase domain-containing protein n=1 Tax=Anopheles albimanus TaxID=7167 RepID=A0A182F4F5_ANOAL